MKRLLKPLPKKPQRNKEEIMAQVTTAMVKQLRERTSAGILDCKNALVACDGDLDKAVDYLREKGIIKAGKKANRIAAEGIVMTEVKDASAVIVEVNSETDFVAKNEKFQNFVKDIIAQVFAGKASTVEELLAEKSLTGDGTVNDDLVNMIATIGEKLSVRRFEKIESDGIIISYVHGGGRIGVLVNAQADDTPEVREALKNVALQIASMKPKYVDENDVDAAFLESEKAILTTQAKNDPANAKKPDNIIEKMILGRIKKELKEICLLDQDYVKGDGNSVRDYLKSVGDIKITGFIRYETGEGLEKKNENFAEEVAKQMQ